MKRGLCGFFFFKQKTAYEMRISDWSSDVCSSDLFARPAQRFQNASELMVGLAELGCEHLHLAGVESTLVRGKRRPCGNALGPRGQLCIGRNDAKLLLSCENTAAGLIQAHVETAAVACDPLRSRLVRQIGRAH